MLLLEATLELHAFSFLPIDLLQIEGKVHGLGHLDLVDVLIGRREIGLDPLQVAVVLTI